VLRYRTGVAGSAAGAKAMSRHLLTETLTPESAELARYYAGEVEPLTLTDQLGQAIADGDMLYSEALDQLMRAEVAISGLDTDLNEIEWRAGDSLSEAAGRAEVRDDIAAEGGTVAEIRADISPRLARLLGLDPHRPPRLDEIANILNGRRADGQAVEGKQQHSPMRSLAETFGLDPKQLPSWEALEHVLAGRMADGGAPRDAKGQTIPDQAVEGARKRFAAIFRAPTDRDLTAEEVACLKAGMTANGLQVSRTDYLTKIHATRSPIAYVDMIWSADKSLSVAWALAPTEAERAMLLQVHRDAVDQAMAYAEKTLGFTRKGKDGRGGAEAGELGWIKYHHYTSRPVAEIVRKDSEGREYTDLREVPLQQADPQLHTHVSVPNVVLTESGRVGSMDLDRLDGLVKELGAVYQAFVARNAAQHGIEVELDRATGAAKLIAIPESARRHFSKRTQDAEEAARQVAREAGEDWDSLSPERKVGLLRKGAEESRHRKARVDGESDFADWQGQAKDTGYNHRSVLRPDAIKPALDREQRRKLAYDLSQSLIEEGLSRVAKLSGQEMREFAARGFIAAGGIDNPGEDIGAVTRLYRERGVRQDGEMTPIIWGKDVAIRGKERWSVTTELHASQEIELRNLARKAGADRSAALSEQAIGRAADAFLARNPKIDPDNAQWLAQRAMIERLATGGRLGVAIGAAGAGKTTALEVGVDAWKAEGRTVYGAAVAWRQASALADAGIAPENRASIAAFLKRVGSGRYQLDRNSVLVIDELGLLGKRQLLDILQLQEKHGFQIVAVGDPKQCQSIEAGPVIELLRDALGPEAVPEILTSIRQRTERERTIAGLFREGRAVDALDMKRQDRTAELVAGGRDRTIQRVAALWRERTEANVADPEFKLTVSAPTNRDAREISLAIRDQMRAMGWLGPDQITIRAADGTGELRNLPLAPGDRVRVFDRLYTGPNQPLASNGDTLEIRAVTEVGMTARNEQGREGFISWSKLATGGGGTLCLQHGYATTIDTAQGTTSHEHINALVDGSKAIHGFKNYVAESRHRITTFMVVNEAAERRQIATRQPLGSRHEIVQADVWCNIAANLSRQPVKASSLDFLQNATSIRRGSVGQLQRGLQPTERRQAEGRSRTTLRQTYDRRRAELAHGIRQAVSYARQVGQSVSRSLQDRHRQDQQRAHQQQWQTRQQGRGLTR
jgi:hypothetical protein